MKRNGKGNQGRVPFSAYPNILADKPAKRLRADKAWSIPARDWQRRFLTEMCKMPNVARACRIARVSSPTAYKLREADKQFAKAWEQAVNIGGQGLEEAAWKRAVKGSDVLAIFLLKAHFPEKYRENVRVTGPDGGPLQHRYEVVVTGVPLNQPLLHQAQAIEVNGNGQSEPPETNGQAA